RCDKASVSRSGFTKARSQDSGNCIMYSSDSFFTAGQAQHRLPDLISAVELAQKAQIAFEKLAQVVHAITQHGQALQPRAKCKPDVAFRVQAKVANDFRVYLP